MFNNLIKLLVVVTLSSTTLAKDIQELELSLPIPLQPLETYAGDEAIEQNRKWATYQVKSYDNLTNIFYKIGHQSILNTLKTDGKLYGELKELKKGSIVRASSNSKGELSELVLTHDTVNSFIITLDKNQKYVGVWKNNIFEIRQARSSFTIRNGLFFDGRKSGIPNKIIQQAVGVFDWGIDFSHDVRVGDKMTIVYEEVFHQGDKVAVRNLITAEFINGDRKFSSFRYINKEGKTDYFKYLKITGVDYLGNLIGYVSPFGSNEKKHTEGKLIGKKISWSCYKNISNIKPLVEIATLSKTEGYIKIDDSTVFTSYNRKGFNHRWDWEEYSFIIKPDGVGLYYDFNFVSEDKTTKPSQVYRCDKKKT